MTDTLVRMRHGAPGCGKTHSILDAVDKHVDEDDLDPWDVYLANFTRNGREDSADDLMEREVWNPAALPKEIEDPEGTIRGRCRTLHSIALSTCPEVESSEQVITMEEDEHLYEEFCRQQGLSFQAEETNPLKLIHNGTESKPIGNELFAVNSWLHAQYLPSVNRTAKLTDCPLSINLPNARVRELLEAWDDFKRRSPEGRVFEHHDYVDVCLEKGHTPDVRLFCIDEFQDLAPVEYALFKLWRDEGDLDWIYVAGDVNQSIYSFRCATPYYLAETEVDEREYLTDSYRCPEAVSAVARGILEQEPEISQNIFRTAELPSGRTPAGSAEMRRITDDESLADAVHEARESHADPKAPMRSEDEEAPATVYLLARTNWQVGVLSQALQQQGLPFSALGDKMTPWPETLIDCLIALRALEQDRPAPANSVDTLLKTASNTEQRRERLENAERDENHQLVDAREGAAVVFPEQIEAAFPSRSAMEVVGVLQHYTDYQQEMLRNAITSDASPEPDRIKVGTIHEAKGLEAPCVMLFSETTSNIIDRMRDDPSQRAEEARIYYVGATRASKTLTVVDGFFDGPRVPIFENGLPGDDQTSDTDASATGVAD